MINVKQLLNRATSEEICKKIIFHYETSRIDEFIKLIERLKQLEPKQNDDNFYLYIKILRAQEDKLYFVDEFDEDDKSVLYDVCGADDAHDCYSIAGSGHAKFLGYNIDDATLQRLSPAAVLAHFLWEVAFFGIEDSEEDQDGAS